MNILIPDYIKGLIFDCDGTLVDSMPLHMKAWEEAFKQFEIYFDYDFLFAQKGMKETEIIEKYNQNFGTNLIPREIVSAKHEYFQKNIESVTPIQPIVDIAKYYFKKLPLAIVSGSVKDIVHKELKVIGIIELFDAILTADDPFKPKPSPDIFIVAAQKIQVDPKNCIVFEDGDPGLEAAINAGMQIVDVRLFL
jgi:beta-phosphoglucomutase-like phosphatase (HAD superfamily)